MQEVVERVEVERKGGWGAAVLAREKMAREEDATEAAGKALGREEAEVMGWAGMDRVDTDLAVAAEMGPAKAGVQMVEAALEAGVKAVELLAVWVVD